MSHSNPLRSRALPVLYVLGRLEVIMSPSIIKSNGMSLRQSPSTMTFSTLKSACLRNLAPCTTMLLHTSLLVESTTRFYSTYESYWPDKVLTLRLTMKRKSSNASMKSFTLTPFPSTLNLLKISGMSRHIRFSPMTLVLLLQPNKNSYFTNSPIGHGKVLTTCEIPASHAAQPSPKLGLHLLRWYIWNINQPDDDSLPDITQRLAFITLGTDQFN